MSPTVPTPADTRRSRVLSPFPPIGDYAFLSDCHTGALVSSDGAVEWLCLPRFDAPSVFGALLDRSAGTFRIGPYAVDCPASRRYEPGTMIVETTWMTASGWLLVRDALVIGPWEDEPEVDHHTRPPTDADASHVLVRTVRCTQGEVQVEAICEPMRDYGRTPVTWELDGPHCVRSTEEELLTLRLATDLRLGIEGNRVRARHTLHEGETVFCALGWGAGVDDVPQSVERAVQMVDATAHYWRDWLDGGRFPDHPWRIHLQRSALTLKGLTYAPTGATVAALTTSLPETPGGERNWDYRYTWIRDATFTLWALHALKMDWEADDFMEFVADLATNEDGALQIMYGVGGERDLTERTLDHLVGYEGSTPVRVGNGAFAQHQNDVYGAVLDSVYLHSKMSGRMPTRLWPVLCQQAEGALRVWREPDQGIWEARGAPQHYVSSKLMCWVALDRASRLAQRRGESDNERRWRAEAEAVREEILSRGVDDRGVFVQHYDTTALDASVLLLPLLRFLSCDDERVRATVMAIASELTEGGLVLRYRTQETDDGLSGKEGTFLICSFWLVSALSEIGERQRARDLLERLLNLASPLGLYAEELEPATHRHLGNFPQAFTHLALINATMHVIADDAAPDGAEH